MLNIMSDIDAMEALMLTLPPAYCIRQWGEKGVRNYALFRTLSIPEQYRDLDVIPTDVAPIVKGMTKEAANKLLKEVLYEPY